MKEYKDVFGVLDEAQMDTFIEAWPRFRCNDKNKIWNIEDLGLSEGQNSKIRYIMWKNHHEKY